MIKVFRQGPVTRSAEQHLAKLYQVVLGNARAASIIAKGSFVPDIQRSGANYYVTIKDGPTVCRQKPIVEVMFDSVAKYAVANAIGAILTGRGDDGAAAKTGVSSTGNDSH